MIHFKKGHKVKVVGPGYTGNTGIVYDVFVGPPTQIQDRVVIIGDWDGQLHNFDSGDLEMATNSISSFGNQKIEFKVGDVVGSTGSMDSTVRYTVEEIDSNSVKIKAVGTDYIFVLEADQMHRLFKDSPSEKQDSSCNHDWKIYHGFMHDDEFCTKCKVTRKLSA